MKQVYTTHSAEETSRWAGAFAGGLKGGTLVALFGDLGAGKTTFTQGLLAGLGIAGPYTSPTFVIMKHYEATTSLGHGIRRVYHVDAYRVGSGELASLGWEEWTGDKEGLVIVEWPENIAELLPLQYIRISLEHVNETSRKITVEDE